MYMEKFTNSKLFVVLIYIILCAIAVYFLMLIGPMFSIIFDFIKAVVGPFIIAMIISYVLHPVVSSLHIRRVPRTIAVLLIYAMFFTGIGVLLMNLIPMVINQLDELNKHLPELTLRAQGIIVDINNSKLVPLGVRNSMSQMFTLAEQRISNSLLNVVNNIGETVSGFFMILVVPFLAFYILKDFDVFERAVIKFVPKTHRKNTVRLLKDIDHALGSYIRGQLLVCFIIGVLAYVGYLIIGLPYALLLAGIVAITNVIPYVGPFIGAAPALLMASTVSIKMMLMVAIVNVVCQILESNIISPQVVGRSLHLHPLIIIFAVLAGAQIAGLVGMILSVPIFAACKVIFQHIFAYYVRRKII